MTFRKSIINEKRDNSSKMKYKKKKRVKTMKFLKNKIKITCE